MLTVPPTSIKFTDEEDARVRALAALLGWSKCKVIRASIDFVDHLSRNPTSEELPEIVVLARLALFNKANPGVLQRHMEHLTVASGTKTDSDPRRSFNKANPGVLQRHMKHLTVADSVRNPSHL